jgi:sugar phosphate isomerase/epimerase
LKTQHNVKRGVSLYSCQEEYFLGNVTLEQAIEKCAAMGAYGIETIAEQMMPGFPNISDEFYEKWHEWMARCGTVPTAHDMFADTKLHKHRLLTDEELTAELRDDIVHASRLGCSVIRILVTTPPEVVEAAATFAIDHGVRLCTEVHAPFKFDDEHIQRHIAVGEKVGPENVGLLPDMGIFTKRFPRVQSERARRAGAHDEIVDFIIETYDSGETGDYVVDIGAPDLTDPLTTEVKKRGGNAQDLTLARAALWYISLEPKVLLDYMPFIHHIHAKFYEMTDEGSEYSVPYEEIIPVLIEGGYDGYLSSEYEGNRHIQDIHEVDSFEQIGRQQAMFARLLGETAD